MSYRFLKDILDLVSEFEQQTTSSSSLSIEDFKQWIVQNHHSIPIATEPQWEGKEKGRSPESVINTLIVHMNRYARSYSKSAIFGSDFTTQEDFIYLINLKAFGEMTKMDLIKKNVHEKPTGMQIINRLIGQGFIHQKESAQDKRSKLISITDKGLDALEKQMHKIRQATTVVTGNLSYSEKMELIRLLNKLNDFHLPIYEKNLNPEYLLEAVLNEKK